MSTENDKKDNTVSHETVKQNPIGRDPKTNQNDPHKHDEKNSEGGADTNSE